jgi:hypothetical protein
MAVTKETPMVNASTVPSIAMSGSRGRFAGLKAAQPLDGDGGEQQPAARAERGQREALGQQLHRDAAAARAEGDAHRELVLPRERARQHQVGDVGAGDQQDEADRSEQNPQRPPHGADHLIEQRHDLEGETAVRRVDVRHVAAQPSRQDVHLVPRRVHAHARLQPRDDVVVLRRPRRPRRRRERQRQKDLARFGDTQCRHHFARQGKAGFQDADDLIRLIVESNGPADRRPDRFHSGASKCRGSESPFRSPRHVVVRFEEPSGHEAAAEQRQQIRRGADAADAFGLDAVAGEVVVRADRHRHSVERRSRCP